MSQETDDRKTPDLEQQKEDFRESLATAEVSGERKWVYARKPHGKFTRYRDIVSALLLISLFVFPFIKINGNPIFLFDILNRQFYIFGAYFSPSDFYLFGIGLVTTTVFIIVFTVIYGRIFCGWICPQTIFMEHVFRKIEFLIDGDRNMQIRLDNQVWNGQKIKKRILKWSLFLIASLTICAILFSYVLGTDEIIKIGKEGISKHITLFIVYIIFTTLFYFVFAWFREQACTFVCPYGRLQGVLIDKDTINIAYDFVRGEGTAGRSKFKKNEDRKALGKGDCIDCKQCVEVCPTGIDIRNGMQMECVNCTACIDACDMVMTRMKMPTGLIKYASENMIEKRTDFKFTPRLIAYTIALFVFVSVCISLLFFRSNVETKFLKIVGTQFTIEKQLIVDEYQFIFINKTTEKKKLHVKIVKPNHAIITLVGYGTEFTIQPKQTLKGTATIKIPQSDLIKTKEEIIIGIFDENGKKIDEYKTNFIGPSKIRF
ncbi:cytochrome c oxidase accessory protein CcoG [Apibacter sp.]|uniref:cytochrome c oxidase accessory protein CcoG n=1 Tax=Apibacter sp. TaxID=2023709 RepID=UPI0025DF52A2|nr:cytochrome c oxidase accessory protein CcoG [Apibacter sp.]MCT6868434.1 cytochrome c oxidase accessory protein CcoG [Apibacter sp.]